MNDYYYYTIIRYFIEKHERPICNRTDRHLMALRIPNRNLLNAYVYLHQGSPCGRWCICRYFNDDDVLQLYKEFTDNMV